MRKILLSLFLLSGIMASAAIRVTDVKGEPLPYAALKVVDRPIGVLTDSLGIGTLPEGVRLTDTIDISFPGYKSERKTFADLTRSGCVSLENKGIPLQNVTVKPGKFKRVVKGKKHAHGIFVATMDSAEGYWTGLEFKAGEGKKHLLTKVGFYHMDFMDWKPMQRMKFRIQIFDMKDVTSDPTDRMIAVGEPIYFEYVRSENEDDNGKFTFTLPDPIALPDHALVAIQPLHRIHGEYWMYKCNVIGKRCWTMDIDDPYWEKMPFAHPYFVECMKLKVKKKGTV
ncbi:MAG: carboxypeptidase-like regulatory domain-containing protein [Duncaniella sp.]|nr:carboxypeptidase-like regulatory domain-containing protein [Duncaniella sp.]